MRENLKVPKDFIMSPKVDYCFKELMKNPETRRGFIGALLNIDPEGIAETVLLPTIQEKRKSDDKYCILDVLVKMDDGTEIDFEMHLNYYSDWDKRSIFYLCEMVTDQLRAGEDYGELKKCIHVGILDFELFPEYNGFHSTFHLCEDKEGFRYSDVLEFHIIELKKIEKYAGEDGDLIKWARFFNSKTAAEFEEVVKGNSYIKGAYVDMQKLSEDEIRRYEYRAREKALRDHVYFTNAARRDGLEEGRKVGLEEGRKEGFKQGEDRSFTLINLLVKDGRSADIKKVSEDSAYRESLFKEYNL